MRKGTRFNNDKYIYAAKNELALLFFGRNHPIYNRLIVLEKKVEIAMPHAIRKIKDSTFVLSRTGSDGHYQSGDAIIEEINKEAKRDVVGVPNESLWKQTFRNLDNMNKLRKATFQDASISDPKDTIFRRKCDIQEEVRKIRVMLRRSKYFENADEVCAHTDITKTINLSPRLIDFSTIASLNMTEYIPSILKDVAYKMNIVYTTKEEQEESEKIENHTVPEIKKEILKIMNSISNKAFFLELYKKEVAAKDERTHTTFYHSLLEQLHNEMANEDTSLDTTYSQVQNKQESPK